MEFPIRYRSEEADCSMIMNVSEKQVVIEGGCFEVGYYREVYLPVKKSRRNSRQFLVGIVDGALGKSRKSLRSGFKKAKAPENRRLLPY